MFGLAIICNLTAAGLGGVLVPLAMNRLKVDPASAARLALTVRYGVLEALEQGARKTWELSAFTLKMLGRVVTGDASLKNISGPLTLADFAEPLPLFGDGGTGGLLWTLFWIGAVVLFVYWIVNRNSGKGRPGGPGFQGPGAGPASGGPGAGEGDGGRDRHPPAAPRNRTGHDVPQPGGRDRLDQHRLLEGLLGALPPGGQGQRAGDEVVALSLEDFTSDDVAGL